MGGVGWLSFFDYKLAGDCDFSPADNCSQVALALLLVLPDQFLCSVCWSVTTTTAIR